MEVQGTIKAIGETATFGAKGFRKRELVITTNDQYPQPLLIEFIQDNCELLDIFRENDEVIISINLRGKEWQSPSGEVKYFNSIQGWKIGILIGENTVPPPSESMIDAEKALNQINELKNEEEDDLPF